MIRECIEEVGLEPIEYEYVAELSFYLQAYGKINVDIAHTYICHSWKGKLIETDEMKPYWFNLNNIPYDNTMANDKYLLPFILEGKKIIAEFHFDENYITTDKNIEEVNTLVKQLN